MEPIDNKTCLRILHQQKVPLHIIRHCIRVSYLGFRIAQGLVLRGHDLDTDLVRAGALLHDVSKMKAIEKGGDHAEMGAEFLERLGLFKVADVVRQHVWLRHPDEGQWRPSEALIVNYADKRVMHTRIVSLDQRFMDLFKRYGKSPAAVEKINYLYHQTRQMEKRICLELGLRPENIV